MLDNIFTIKLAKENIEKKLLVKFQEMLLSKGVKVQVYIQVQLNLVNLKSLNP